MLRYVHLEDGTLFNLIPVENGYAEARAYPPDVKYSDVLGPAEEKARAARKGLWNN